MIKLALTRINVLLLKSELLDLPQGSKYFEASQT